MSTTAEIQFGNARGLLQFTFDVTEVLELSKWVDKFDMSVDSGEPITRAVRVLGAGLLKNWGKEGALYGNRRWQSLTRMTQETRAQRGFDPKHPILVQKGYLRNMTAGMLAGWTVGRRRDTAGDGKGTKSVAVQINNRFWMGVSGPKATNQDGGRQTAYTPGTWRVRTHQGGKEFYIPARPFLYIPEPLMDEMARAAASGILINWASRSKGRAKSTGEGLFSVAMGANTQRGKVAV